ncbi:MAG: flavodoxin [Clostridiales bacterium]|nr:flavodoxin [Clostridiales bacterium]
MLEGNGKARKGLILYKSKYGATKKYASWLQEETDFDCIETKRATIKDVAKYDSIILCGGLYASGIAGISFLKKHFSVLRYKKLAVFCVGASPFDQKAFEQVRAHNFKEELQSIPLFYGRGAWHEEAMSFKDRMLCGMLRKAVAKKDPSTFEPWMTALMGAVGQVCDWTDKNELAPLIAYIKAETAL